LIEGKDRGAGPCANRAVHPSIRPILGPGRNKVATPPGVPSIIGLHNHPASSLTNFLPGAITLAFVAAFAVVMLIITMATH